MYEQLEQIIKKPNIYCSYTSKELWNDPHVSQKMLECHLDPNHDHASRNADFMDQSLVFIKERFDLKSGKSVIDFGCGPGLYTTRFAQLGCAVRGLDFSKRSIDHAQKTAKDLGLDIEYQCIDYLTYRTDKTFDLATMIYCDYCALSDQQRSSLLHIISSSLKQEGALLLDVHTKAHYHGLTESTSFDHLSDGGFWSADPYFIFESTFKYDQSMVSLDKYTIIQKNKIINIYNWLKHFSVDSIKSELLEHGLEVIEVYADVKGTAYKDTSDTMAIVAIKRKDG